MTLGTNGFAKKTFAAAAALSLISIAFAGGASAEPTTPVIGNIDSTQQASLTINKWVGTENAKTPLGGITFNIRECESFDIADPADWQAVGGWTDETDCETLGDAVPAVTDANGTVTKDLAQGAYWVTEDQVTLPAGVSGSVSFWVVLPYPDGQNGWQYDVTVNPKNTITGDGDKTADSVEGVTVNSVVNWTLTSPVLGSEKVPAGSTSLSVTDFYGAHQTYVANSAKLLIQKPTDAAPVSVATGLTATDSPATSEVTFAIDWATTTPTYPAGTQFFIEYQTTVISMPATGDVVNDTDWGSDATYWGSFDFIKKDAANGLPLSGAVFEIYKGTCPGSQAALVPADLVTTVTSVDGQVESGQLYVATGTANANTSATYCLVEKTAPVGYVAPAWADGHWGITLEAGDNPTILAEGIGNTKISGPELPVTGANGTKMLTIGGISLIAVAGGAYLVTRRKGRA